MSRSIPWPATLADAEARWFGAWVAGPTEPEGVPPRRGSAAASTILRDDTGSTRELSEFWAQGPALVMFWRHFGCGCGIERAQRLREEYEAYVAAGLHPVIVGQADPARAQRYREEQQLPCPIVCDETAELYRAYGLGHWPVERVLFDAPEEYWGHEPELGGQFQQARRAEGRPLVDDPWRAVGEFVVADGKVWLSVMYQHCEDYPDPRLLTTSARLIQTAGTERR